jgi:tetratricopeptide (TPR) repeat protein
MTDHDRLSRIFLKACMLEPEERAAFLDQACTGDASLRREVEAMLSQDAGTGASERLDRPVRGVAETPEHEAESAPSPKGIGRYRILDRIGEGSMGVVYRARQENPDRDVALKVIGQGMPTAEMLRRFEVETQVLGRLQHPGIAQIIEAGVTDSGQGSRPFFAMEYVEGLPLTSYASKRGLGIRERLELMIRVCDGVQHAHQRGVIHRDLKPANVLVDGAGQPRILDFGVARLMEPDGNMTAHTHHGVLIGTLGYMSPEQVRGDAAEVDTRADVYSLGAVCYELLTGRLPHDLGGASLPEAIRRIAETPARRLSSDRRSFASDLETIVARALESDRERRYGSASELAADLRRFLADEPIAARSPSALDHVRKLVARNRLVSGLVAALILALAGFGVVMAIQAARIRAERDRAEREADIAGQVSKFLGDVFRMPSPNSSAGGKNVTAREVLDRGVARIRGELAGAPQVRSRLTLAMADAYLGLGLQEDAERLFEETLENEALSVGRDPEVRVRAISELGWIHRSRGKYDEGIALLREAEEVALASFGPEHPVLARVLLLSGVIFRDKQEFDEADERLDQARAIYERTTGVASEEFGRALYHKGWLLHLQKRDEEALKIYERACPIIERALSGDHPFSAWCANDMSVVLSSLNRLDDASAAMTRAVATWDRILPPDHPDLAAAVDNLGSLHLKARDFERAAEDYRRGLEMRRRALGPDHVDVARSLHNLALVTRKIGAEDEAIAQIREAIGIFRKTVGPDHASTHNAQDVLAGLYWRRGELEPSIEINREMLSSLERTRGPDDPKVSQILRHLGEALLLAGRAREAEGPITRALAIREKLYGPSDPRIAASLVILAQCREALGMRKESAGLYERAAGILEAAPKLDDMSQAFGMHHCSRWARRTGNAARADALLARTIAEHDNWKGLESSILYLRAVAAAHRGETESSLDLLRQSLEQRLPLPTIDLEVDLAPLAGTPELRTLAKRFGFASVRR